MGNLETLLPEIRQFTPKAPDTILERELRNATAQFLSDTFVWKKTFTFSADGEQTRFPLELETGERLVRIERVHSSTRNFLPHISTSARHGNRSNYYLEGNEISFFEAPTTDITVVMSVSNTRTSDEIPQEIIEKYGSGLVAGALARVCAYPERGFTSPSLVQWGNAVFGQAIDQARAEAQGQNSRVVRKTRFSW